MFSHEPGNCGRFEEICGGLVKALCIDKDYMSVVWRRTSHVNLQLRLLLTLFLLFLHFVFQQSSQDLTGSALWDLIDESYATTEPLVIRHFACSPLDDFFRLRLSCFILIRWDDIRSWNFSFLVLVIHADYSDIVDKWMIHELAFEFRRCNLEAFVLDELFDSIGDVEVVVGVLVSYVSRLEIAETIFDRDGFVCGLFILPVTLQSIQYRVKLVEIVD